MMIILIIVSYFMFNASLKTFECLQCMFKQMQLHTKNIITTFCNSCGGEFMSKIGC